MNILPDIPLPSSIEGERILLAAVMIDNAYWDQVSQLPQDAWSLDSHRRIRMAMKRLHDSGSAIDQLTVSTNLHDRNEIDAVGGWAYISDLDRGVPRRPAVEDYVRIVREKMMLRKTMLICSNTIARAADQSKTAIDVIGDAQSQLEAICEPVMQSSKAPVRSFIAHALHEINEEYRTRVSPCIPSGNAWFDAKSGGGYRMHNITLVCARANQGKTPWAVMSLAYNLQAGRKCVMFSLEKKKESILRDLVPYVADVPNIAVNNAWRQTPEQNALVNLAMETICDWPLSVYDEKMDCEQILWAIDRETKDGSEVLFIIDHFGMIATSAGRESQVERDNSTSARLRDKIKTKRSALVILRQLKKVSREFADSAPVADDVKGTSNTWEDAFAALIIHRTIDKETKKLSREVDLNLAKLRTGGSTGSTKGTFDVRRLCFEAQAEMEYEESYYDGTQY